jgi:hypothetical protein
VNQDGLRMDQRWARGRPRIGKGWTKDGVRDEPRMGQGWTKHGPGMNQDRLGVDQDKLGVGQGWTKDGPGVNQG